MSKASPTSPHPTNRPSPAPVPRARRLNPRAVVILAVVIVAALPALIALKTLRDQWGRAAFLREARARLAKGETPLALGYLNRYLELNPNDFQALDLKAKILAETARTTSEAQEAERLHTRVLGRDPNGPGRLETRRRLVRLHLMLSREVAGQAQAAEIQAKALIDALGRQEGGRVDPEARRLLAQALEAVAVVEPNPKQSAAKLAQALEQYQKAEEEDPGDIDGAARLAALYRERLEEPAKARAVLDRVVKTTARDPKAHARALLALGEHLAATGALDEAGTILDRAAKDDPSNADVHLAAASAALARRDTASARLHLAAVPVEGRDDKRVRYLEGLIDMAEERPGDAIQAWRAGLLQSGGTDADLTWNLALVLLDVGRLAEGEPLMNQYLRLSGNTDDDPDYRYLKGLDALRSDRPKDAVEQFEAIRYRIKQVQQERAREGRAGDLQVRAKPYQIDFALGQAFEATGVTSKALDAYLQAAEASRGWESPWLAAADLQLKTEGPAAASETLRRGLARMPGNPSLLFASARLVWDQEARKPSAERSLAEAEQLLQTAKKTAPPGAPEIALLEADYLTASGREEDAQALLEAACRLNPRAHQLWQARINARFRRNKFHEALTLIDQAIAQAGPQAGFYVTRSSLHVAQGDISKAKAALQEGLGKIPTGQKPVLWKTLGDFYLALRDYPSARASYDEWSKLQPRNPDPKLAILDVALTSGDEAAIGRAVEAVRGVSGSKGVHWRYARGQNLLRDRPGAVPDSKRDAARLDEAARLVKEIEADAPQAPQGPLLRGQLEERRDRPDEAIQAYREALKLNAGDAALTPLVALLLRTGRDAEIDQLARDYKATPGRVEQIAAMQALRLGKKDKAEQLAEAALKGDPRALDPSAWQVDVFKALGKPDEAERALKRLIEQKPGEPAPWLQLLMLQVRQRKTAEAAVTVEQIRQKVKTDYPELLWAQCYRAIGNPRRAAECYADALQRWPTEPTVLTSAVTFYEQAGLKDRAEAVLRGLLRRDPANAWARRQLAQSLAGHAGNRPAWDEALALIGPEPRTDDVPEDRITRARVYAQGATAENATKAVAILQGVVEELPDQATAQELLARLLLAQGRLSEARDHAAHAARGGRATPDAVLLHAGILLDLKAIDQAETELNRLAQVDPDGLPVAELRARVLQARGQAKDAADVLEKAFNDRVQTPEGLFVGTQMVRLLRGLGQPAAAERVARRTAELGPRGRCALAELLAASGRLDEAAHQLEQAGDGQGGDSTAAANSALALASRPKADPRWLPLADRLLARALQARPEALDLLNKQAVLRHLQRRFQDEVDIYRALIDRAPANFAFLNNLAWTLSEEMNQPAKALEWIDEAIRKIGSRPDVLDTRGVILTRLKRYDEAVRDLEAAARGATNATFFYHLARAYQHMGQADKARAYRDRAQQAGLDPSQLESSERADYDAVMNP